MTQYKVGKVVKGNITGIENYGIFVNLDNYYSGLIHISEISEGFVKDINDYGKVGDTIYSRIIEVNEDTNQLKLSIKNMDYKKNEHSNKNGIRETGTGFKILEDKLPIWISEKLTKIKE